MKLLGIETATLVCGTAIVEDGVVLAEEFIERKNAHAENIMARVNGVFRSSGVRLSELDAIAVSIGPGSFTGLRIGLSVAKGLCYSADKPLVAVSTLYALARRALQSGKVATRYLLPAIDARRDEVYAQLFRVNDNLLESGWAQQDVSIAELAYRLNGLPVSVTGDARGKIVANERMRMLNVVPDEFALCRGGIIAIVGEEMARRGEIVDPMPAEPLYLKAFYSLVP